MFEHFVSLTSNLYKKLNKTVNNISDIDLINYREDSVKEWYLGLLSGFLKKWYEMGYPGVNKSAYAYLSEVRLKGNAKGIAVLTMDPIKGPFTDLELEKIQSAINNSYADGEIKEDEYILVWLFMIYGSRPIQLAQLKVKDVIETIQNDGSYEAVINIPRAKNRQKPRSEFKRRSVPNSLVKVLINYKEKVKSYLQIYMKDISEAPLFPSEKLNNENGHDLKYHITANDLKIKIENIFSKFQLISERTGETMHVTPTRFRRTLGTRAAQEGHGELIIAEILDHTDIQNAGVYTQATPEILNRIDKAIAMEMAPIAQAFEGKLVIDKTSVLRLDDPTADIVNPSKDGSCKNMGKCGSFGFCGLMSPLACYTCSSFQAWTDGPHEDILAKLIEDRKRLMETTDYRVASINDKTIMAVAQVVLACKEYNKEDSVEVLV